MTTFDSTKASLHDLLREIKEGKIQLPDFQRGWVCDDDHIRDLLMSIARSFPIGLVARFLRHTPARIRLRHPYHPGASPGLREHGEVLATATVVWHEMIFGVQRLPRSRKRSVIEQYMREVVAATVPLLPYDVPVERWHQPAT